MSESRADACISRCGRYRYWLRRCWNPRGATVRWIMLNPSTADAVHDDPTIRRCVGFAQSWGAGGIVVVNLFAYRATSPHELFAAADPIGPDNDFHLTSILARGRSPVIAAWGCRGGYQGRAADVLRQVATCRIQLRCLGRTAGGQPRHPLYLPARQPLQPFLWGS